MAVFVQGARGSGKTKVAVKEIQDALRAGRRVATNLNIRLDRIAPDIPDAYLLRLPDFPRSIDLISMGVGYEGHDPSDEDSGYDESKFGLLVLDEMLTFFNARSWNDSDRLSVINWLVQSRKMGWRLWLLGQHIDGVDAQIRNIIEYLYVCRSSGQISIPFVSQVFGAIGRIFTGGKGFPKFHLLTVYSGIQKKKHSWVESSFYRYKSLESCYNTKQLFRLDIQPDAHGSIDKKTGEISVVDMRAIYQVLPPRYLVSWYSKLDDSKSGIASAPRSFLSLIFRGALVVCSIFACVIWVLHRFLSDPEPSSSRSLPLASPLNSAAYSLEVPDLVTDIVITAAVLVIDDSGRRHYEYSFSRGDRVFRPAWRDITVRAFDECRASFRWPDGTTATVTCDERLGLSFTNAPRIDSAGTQSADMPDAPESRG